MINNIQNKCISKGEVTIQKDSEEGETFEEGRKISVQEGNSFYLQEEKASMFRCEWIFLTKKNYLNDSFVLLLDLAYHLWPFHVNTSQDDWMDGCYCKSCLPSVTFPVHHPKLKDSLFSLAWILLPLYILTLKKVLKECLLLNFKFPVSFYFPEMTMAFQNSPFLIGALAPILLLFKCHLTQMKLLRFIWL